eukprot:SAG31_NODE_554_length_14181_cov_22.378000_6_plen_557_part_00
MSQLVATIEPDDEILPDQLPTIALLSATLSAEDSKITVQIFSEASTLGVVGTDAAELVSLLSSKLDLLSSLYRTKLATQATQVQRHSQQQQLRRSELLFVDDGRRPACGEQELLQQCHEALVFLVHMSHAHEYATLTDDCVVQSCQGQNPGLLDDLVQSKLSASQYYAKLATAYRALVSSMNAVVESSSNCGGSCWAAMDFQLSDVSSPFTKGGELTVSIDIPAHAGLYAVTFSDVRVFLLGVENDLVTVEATKTGVSRFLGPDRKIWTFTHMPTPHPPFQIGYQTATCESTFHTVATSSTRDLCDLDTLYMKHSPYGTWDLTVVNEDEVDLSAVRAVRFVFNVNEIPFDRTRFPAADGLTVFRSVGDVDGRCTLTSSDVDRACHLLSASSPSSSPMSSRVDETDELCNYANFVEHQHEVEAACCRDNPCDANNLPVVCSSDECANALESIRSTCASMLGVVGVRSEVDNVAETCPTATTNSCASFVEFSEASQAVTAACCDGTRAICAAGIPSTCIPGCDEALRPFHEGCHDYLAHVGMLAVVESTLALCGRVGH